MADRIRGALGHSSHQALPSSTTSSASSSRLRHTDAPVRRNLFQSQLTRRPTPTSSNSAETVRLDSDALLHDASASSASSSEIVVRNHNGEFDYEAPPTLDLLDDGDEPPADDEHEIESKGAFSHGFFACWMIFIRHASSHRFLSSM
jgi:hypothetical protein